MLQWFVNTSKLVEDYTEIHGSCCRLRSMISISLMEILFYGNRHTNEQLLTTLLNKIFLRI